MAALGPAMGILSNIKGKINDVLPEADGELNEINTTFNDILANATGIGNNSFNFNNYEEEDVGKILDEASFIAEQRTGMDIPDVPPTGGKRDIQKSRSVREHSENY